MENLNAGNELWSFTEGERIKGKEVDRMIRVNHNDIMPLARLIVQGQSGSQVWI